MSPRLYLRPFHLSDATAVAALAGDPAIADTMISMPHPLDAARAAALVDRYLAEHAERRGYHAAVCQTDNGQLVAGVALRDVDAEHHQGELSFWVGREWWGSGYAAEAGELAVAIAFDELRLNRVTAYHMVRNPASGRVLTKLGFRCEGLLRERVYKAGRYEDVLAYALLRGDYRRAS